MNNTFSLKTDEQARVTISMDVAAEDQSAMMEKFAACQNGTCNCQTTEYEKLQKFDLLPTPNGLKIQLTPKAGQTFRTEEIERCVKGNLETGSCC